MDDKSTRMIFATAALAAVAAVLAGPAGAYIQEGDGVQPVASQSDGWQAQSSGDVVVPYLSHGQGVDKAQFSGAASRKLAGQAASQQGLDVAIKTAIASRSNKVSQVEQQTIPYLSQGIGVDKSQFGGTVSGRPTGVHAALVNRDQSSSTAQLPHGAQVVLPRRRATHAALRTDRRPALTRASTPESQSLGLTGDSPADSRLRSRARRAHRGRGAVEGSRNGGDGHGVRWERHRLDIVRSWSGMVALIAAGLVGILLTTRRRHTVGLP